MAHQDSGDCLDDLTNCCPLSAPWERIHSFQSLPSFQFPVARNKQTAALQPICFVPRPSAHVMKYRSPKILIFFNLFLESQFRYNPMKGWQRHSRLSYLAAQLNYLIGIALVETPMIGLMASLAMERVLTQGHLSIIPAYQFMVQ